ncbi:hypothetical protein HQ325_03090 [Rhodococcus sp. BP-349]|uniref:hypothetical protein n=1 Tax=unclassified Rhodococcus (in: high G+C Gram-positive bacteria) TaxID=192944 RepID=UPI001C9B9961|nr:MULTISPECIES: hypothetical protein [unclassified Rhodococcus (in: high G+C Gram-positive bacteria)]MBY6537649.1 hypothetical protein [Rhodococcus sp. BP-363]MBY6541986.1 hypothetical protein [Rhodococcus sp. BP-369]MBY6561216.1 hypothetical protein [Rhodococcus sp. BP-370]MBY6575508.1 hypothetical protein [Rhodococcus sp. BP-364]MBY6584809.1 hypothetical protein [Rhodococcus sp. BP-358]
MTGATTAIEATVRRRTPTGEPGRTPLAHGVFVDDVGAHEFIRHQVQTLPDREGDDVMIQLVTVDGDGPARPTRNIVGSTESVLADLDHPDEAAHAISSVLTRIAQTRSVDVAAVLEHAAASAAANVGGTDTLLAASPQSESAQHVAALAAFGTDPQLPLAKRTAPVVLYLETRDQQLSDYGIQELWHRDRTSIRAAMRPADLPSSAVTEHGAELVAVDRLYAADTDAYLAAWTAAATEKARRMGLRESVPVVVSTEETEFFDDGDLEPIYDHAFSVAPLPGCGYIPDTFPHRSPDGGVDVEAFITAEHADHRGYRDRARGQGGTDEQVAS